MRHRMRCIAFVVLTWVGFTACVPPAAAQTPAAPWEACRAAPLRSCVLDEAVGLVVPLGRSGQRSDLLLSLAKARARAGDTASAAALVMALPAGNSRRIAGLRELAEAQARTGHQREARETFDQVLQLAYAWKDPLQRASDLTAIAKAQAASDFASAADETFDQALQAAQGVRTTGELARMTTAAPEGTLAQLLSEVALHQAAMGQLTEALETARSIRYDLVTRAATLVALADVALKAGARLHAAAILHDALETAHRELAGGEPWPSYEAAGMRRQHGATRTETLLCDIARAAARADFAAEAAATFEEAARAVDFWGPEEVPFALARIADAERAAGLAAAAQATLARAAGLVDSAPERFRPWARKLVAEVQARAGLADAAARTMALAREEAAALAAPDWRATALADMAALEARLGHAGEAAGLFQEALATARASDAGVRHRVLAAVARAQDRAGAVEGAAATFGEALAARAPGGPTPTIEAMLGAEYGARMLAASPALRGRLVDVAQEITDPLDRAALLCAIARALPD